MTDKGEFGEIYYAKTSYLRRRGTPTGWFTDKRVSGGGPILDIAVHRIDAAWYMMGNPKPVRVSAAVSNRLGEFQTKGIQRWQGTPCPDNKNDTEDFGAGVIHFENGAILLFEASWAINGPDYQYTQLYGTKGGITLDPLTIYGERNGYLSDDRLNPGPGKSFELEIAHFVDCILTGRAHPHACRARLRPAADAAGHLRFGAAGTRSRPLMLKGEGRYENLYQHLQLQPAHQQRGDEPF